MIGEIKDLLEVELGKVSDSVAEVKSRLSVCESQGEQMRGDIDNLKTNLISEISSVLMQNKDSIVAPVINEVIEQLNSKINMLQSTCTPLDKAARKANIILKGLSNGNTLESVNNFFFMEFGIGSAATDTYCINEETLTCRVKLRDQTVKATIMRTKRVKLGARPIYIDNDLTPMEAEISWKLREKRKEVAKEGRSVVLRGNSISIDNVWYYWDLNTNSLARRGKSRTNKESGNTARGGRQNREANRSSQAGGSQRSGSSINNPALQPGQANFNGINYAASINGGQGGSWSSAVMGDSRTQNLAPQLNFQQNGGIPMNVVYEQAVSVPTGAYSFNGPRYPMSQGGQGFGHGLQQQPFRGNH